MAVRNTARMALRTDISAINAKHVGIAIRLVSVVSVVKLPILISKSPPEFGHIVDAVHPNDPLDNMPA